MMVTRKAPATLLAIAALLLFASCQPSSESPLQPANAGAVVVYADYSDASYLPEYFAAFTEATSIRVIVRNAAGTVDDVIADQGSPPADVLLTRDVSGIWRAADKGALRPLALAAAQDRLPSWSRDPDGYWAAISARTVVIAYNVQDADFMPPASYSELAEPRFRQRLCLSSSSITANRTVIAMLIDQLGVRPAEIVVRGWMANLSSPVFEDEGDLLQAIQNGQCQVAMLSSSSFLMLAENADVKVRAATVARYFANIEGVGIARHARNPESAAMLIEWMLTDAAQSYHQARTFSYSIMDVARLGSVDPGNVSTIGWRDEEVAKLAERAGYR